MKIAVIGWRCLIWDPCGMDLEPQWHSDGSVLPVEFARFSSQPVLTSVLVEGAVLLALAATWGYLTLWKRSGGARNDAQPVEIAKDGPALSLRAAPVAAERHDIASIPQWTPLLRSRDECMDTRRSCVRWRTEMDADERKTFAQHVRMSS